MWNSFQEFSQIWQNWITDLSMLLEFGLRMGIGISTAGNRIPNRKLHADAYLTCRLPGDNDHDRFWGRHAPRDVILFEISLGLQGVVVFYTMLHDWYRFNISAPVVKHFKRSRSGIARCTFAKRTFRDTTSAAAVSKSCIFQEIRYYITGTTGRQHCCGISFPNVVKR